jgi:hypothetical protein
VVLSAGVAVAFAGVFVVGKAPLAVRVVVGVLLAAGLGGLFLHRFPEMISGPYGGMDPALARIILDEISEAQPMKAPDVSWLGVFWAMASSCVAVPAGLYFFAKASDVQRWLWGVLMTLLLAALALTLFYQRRFIGTLGMLEVLPLAVLLHHGWVWIGAHLRGRRQFFAELALILLVGPLPAVLLPAMADGRSFNTGVLLFPVSITAAQTACQMYNLESALRNPMGLGSRQHMIMNTMGAGPELLFRTNHKVLSAPFHMDVDGNVDATRFFSTPYPDEAEAIVRRRNIDLVVTCLYADAFYFDTNPWSKVASDQHGPGNDFAPHFIERLISGHIPAWLKPVKAPGVTNFVIYEVLPPAPATKAE